ncbi:2-amino-4-hydroxy-6-hydroxymethyldihydropteridine diphosphokinase [Pseudaestuariivita rosea]|uniref:2-amino-4-hydroxy-6- hydroxymethyldihydropteridine diphosphokinase n=1 Tax=Pseudaestuariivita rosea TaxID=2763263 RepID=UPI001ABB4589|nr:2-amino-4-hydroxy-6-hydroxymethyldihydropteridine diphosphokinase [Pseudaestuariivita rosea]
MSQPHVQEVAANTALISLGSNARSSFGEPLETIKKACFEIEKRLTISIETSNCYATPCFPVGYGADYVNAAVRFETKYTPHALLSLLHEIETVFGRERVQRWGSRSLDLDLLAVGQTILPNHERFNHWLTLPGDKQRVRTPDELILPHPRLQDRPFVLVPLQDIASDWAHPVLRLTVTEMLQRLPAKDIAQIKRI